MFTCTTCTTCNRDTPLEEIGLTSCQTNDCICRDCYDYTCRECGQRALDTGQTYLDDSEPINVCDNCRTYRDHIEAGRVPRGVTYKVIESDGTSLFGTDNLKELYCYIHGRAGSSIKQSYKVVPELIPVCSCGGAEPITHQGAARYYSSDRDGRMWSGSLCDFCMRWFCSACNRILFLNSNCTENICDLCYLECTGNGANPGTLIHCPTCDEVHHTQMCDECGQGFCEGCVDREALTKCVDHA